MGDENIGLFNSPIFTFNENIYVAFVQEDEQQPGVYQTVVGKYSNNAWEFSVVEPHNMLNKYHAQPSLAVDTDGYIHVTYNMHSSPWQYSVSREPEDISTWEFRGQTLNGPHNKIESSYGFYTAEADIPGLRITYQTMHTDRNGKIYIAFREAGIYSGVSYSKQRWSLGIASYDVSTKTWSRVGPNPDVDTSALAQTFATEYDKRPQGAKIFFDVNNRMHVSWTWYAEYEDDGSGHLEPNWATYAYSDDGGMTFYRADNAPLTLPISIDQTDIIVPPSWLEPVDPTQGYFYAYTEINAMPNGTPYVWIMPKSGTRPGTGRAFCYRMPRGGWSQPILAPYGATKFAIDDNGIITFISSGIRIHRSYDNGRTWIQWEIDLTDGSYAHWVDYSYTPATGQLRFLAQSNSTGELRVYTVNFSDVVTSENESVKKTSSNVLLYR
ncbi:MAG: hypothetical protein A2Z25_00750 [Planctomycetes bacterium RBG_16_55_9]|nr:MAG: hypothetical protein A2Z25_00750 [Planctomycetes bacterium RBG_16_55_9]